MQAQLFTATALKKLFEDRIVKSKAVGLDGTRLEHFTLQIDSEVELISRKVISSSYKFTNYREKLISKGAGKYPRQISIPTVRDRLTMRALCNALSDIAPTSRNKPPHSIISSVVKEIRLSNQHVSFLRIDIMDFFPSIRHDILLAELESIGCQPFLIELVKAAIKNPTGMRALTKINELGVPQGLSISNILSSIYLRRFDEIHAQDCAYFRYVDDILIVLPSHRASGKFKTIYADLERIGLRPHMLGVSGKSEINQVSTGVDYLGYHVTAAKVSVRQSSYRRIFVNLSNVLTLFKYKRKLEAFIFKINLRITGCVVDGKRKGWLMFFSQTENISQLAYLDKFVKHQLAKLGIINLYPKIATFVKTYHEIRYKGDQSSYIPNFDSYDLEQKYLMIAALTNSSLEELQSRSVEATEYEFKSLVAREVADLEQDMLQASS